MPTRKRTASRTVPRKETASRATMRTRNTPKKSSVGLTLGMLAVFIVLGIVYLATGKDLLGLFTTPTPTALATTSAPLLPTNTAAAPSATTGSTAGWWEVYFTDPLKINDPNNYAGSIEDILIQKINAAQTSIHIASFEFDLTPVAEALIAAHNRGVDVRWVTDDEHGLEADEEPDHGQFAMLKKAGIEIKDDGRSALMHNKFWIFDGKFVWTGSTNVTISGIFKQNNNVIVIHSPEVAAIYEREFQEMWAGNFGPRSPSTQDQQSVTVNGTPIQVLFASEDEVLEALIPYLENAQKSIHFLAFSFTEDSLGKPMIERYKKGVDVSGVFEKVGSDGQGGEMIPLMCAGVPVRQDSNPSFMHNKVIIVDNRVVITGSLNFSASAAKSNDENVIIVENPEIAALYTENFNTIWALSTAPDATKFTCP